MLLEKYMRDGVTVIALDGDLDSHSAPEVHTGLGELIPAGGAMLLDLRRLRYMSSAGLRVLLLVYRKARQDGVRLALSAIPDEVSAVMAATGFLDAFTVAGSVADGVEALSS
jgi:anti-sigma B factor antagonist